MRAILNAEQDLPQRDPYESELEEHILAQDVDTNNWLNIEDSKPTIWLFWILGIK